MEVKRIEVKPAAVSRWDHVLVAAAGRYKALKKIADGGTAEVFLGEHVGSKGFRRLVVLKRIHAALMERPELNRILVEEAHVASQLSHGNLVEVRDLGETHGRHFLVLERVDGWSFAQLLERARAAKVPVPARVALHVVAEVARGLQHAHDRGIVHCDICPHNILIAETGEVKLTDFGIARMPGRPVPKGLVAGKPAYMSPEQARAESLDGRSDIFSLGTVLYLALTGTLPFKGRDDGQMLERVAKGDSEPAQKRMPELQKELAHVVTAAMRPEPWARYQTAHELVASMELVLRSNARTELEQWLARLHEADHAVPPAREKGGVVVPLKVVRTAATKPLPPKRRPVRWAVAAAAVLVLAFGAERSWRWWGSLAAATQPYAAPALGVVGALAPPSPPPLVPASAGPAVFEQAEAAAAAYLPYAPAAPSAPAVPSVDVGDINVVAVDEAEPQVHAAPADFDVRAHVTGLHDQDRAMVMLETEPAGARVLIDGRELGVTPVTVRFRTGIPFELVFVRDNRAPMVKWLLVERPKTGGARATLTQPVPR